MIREVLGESWKRIGTHFENRDHSSVIHAYNKIEELRHCDAEVQDMHRQARRALGLDSE
jgi:chromosomal replication initiation ATPase DnaA